MVTPSGAVVTPSGAVVTPSGVVVLTDRRIAAGHAVSDAESATGPLVKVVAAAIAGGARWVVLRERDLGYAERRALADALRAVVPPGRLIVAGSDPLGGDAVHLSASDRAGRRSTPVEREGRHPTRETSSAFHWSAPVAHPTPTVRLIGRSCHGAGEIARLSDEDYVTLSPVFETATKPGYGPALTPGGAARLAPPVPWLALGGIDSAARARECAAAGAAGVAVLGAVMRAADPERLVCELAGAFAEPAARPSAAPGRPVGVRS
jgi:thiamine-phosphate pyrophosphorylase